MSEYVCQDKKCPFWGTNSEICNNCTDLEKQTISSIPKRDMETVDDGIGDTTPIDAPPKCQKCQLEVCPGNC